VEKGYPRPRKEWSINEISCNRFSDKRVDVKRTMVTEEQANFRVLNYLGEDQEGYPRGMPLPAE
jgi:hypothetical protein